MQSGPANPDSLTLPQAQAFCAHTVASVRPAHSSWNCPETHRRIHTYTRAHGPTLTQGHVRTQAYVHTGTHVHTSRHTQAGSHTHRHTDTFIPVSTQTHRHIPHSHSAPHHVSRSPHQGLLSCPQHPHRSHSCSHSCTPDLLCTKCWRGRGWEREGKKNPRLSRGRGVLGGCAGEGNDSPRSPRVPAHEY